MTGRLLSAWFWLHLVSTLAIAAQPSTPATLLGRYSPTAATLLIVFIITLPAAWYGSLRLIRLSDRLHLPPTIHAGLVLGAAIGIASLWGFPGASATSYLVVRLYFTGIALTAAIWSLDNLFPTSYDERRSLAWLLPLIVVGAALGLLWLTRTFPGVRWIDEAYMAGLSKNFMLTGQLKPLIYEYVDTESYAIMYMGLGVWYRVFGFGFAVSRLFIYAVGLGAMGVTWFTIYRVYNAQTAWLSVLLGVFALVPLNLLRQDVSVALYLGIALLVWVIAEKRQRHWLHVIVGFFVAFATDGHPNAYRFSFAFGAAYLLEYALILREQRRFVWYPPLLYLVVGGVLGVAAYVGLYVTLTDDFLKLASDPLLESLSPPRVVLDQMVMSIRSAPILFGTAMIGLVVGVRSSSRFTRLLLVVQVVNVLIIALFYGYYRTYYVAQSIGLFVLMTAVLMDGLQRDLSRRAVVGLALLMLTAHLGLLFNQRRQPELANGFNAAITAAQQARAAIPTAGVVVGSDPMYFALHDYGAFVEYATAGWVRNKFGTAEAELWEQVNPDAVLIVYNNPESAPQSLLAYLDNAAYPAVACWESSQIGRIDLYIRDGAIPSDLTCTLID